MELEIPVNSKDRTKAVLKLLNPFISNLTDREITLVSTMIDMDIESLTKDNRADLRDKLKMDKYSFNNYVLILKKKGVLLQTTEDIRLNPKLKNVTTEGTFTIKFIS